MPFDPNDIPADSPRGAPSHAPSRPFGDARRVIDVHHHFEPTARNVDGTAWSIERAIDEMDRSGVTTAIGYAGPIFSDDVKSGGKRPRAINDWSAQLCREHPGRFGLFASLAMTDVDAALAEIAYAFDVLGADGVGLATHYDGEGLGAARFQPIFAELNRRHAVVYVHPAGSPCSIAPTVSYESDLISAPWIEFPTNTARTIVSLWAAQTTRRFPDLKFIFCHGGGVLPILLGRIAGFTGWAPVGPERLRSIFPDGVYAAFAAFYFECAQAYAPEAFALIRGLVPPTHLLYGSDFSYFPIAHSAERFGALDISDELRALIAGGNAAALLPRWSG